MSTGSTARKGMFVFVGIIFAIAVVIGGAYMLFLTPGETNQNQPSPQAIQQN